MGFFFSRLKEPDQLLYGALLFVRWQMHIDLLSMLPGKSDQGRRLTKQSSLYCFKLLELAPQASPLQDWGV